MHVSKSALGLALIRARRLSRAPVVVYGRGSKPFKPPRTRTGGVIGRST